MIVGFLNDNVKSYDVKCGRRIDGGILLSIHYDTVDGSEIPKKKHLGCIKPYK